MIEARCPVCLETFTALGLDDLEHAQRADGADCGGHGETVAVIADRRFEDIDDEATVEDIVQCHDNDRPGCEVARTSLIMTRGGFGCLGCGWAILETKEGE